MSERTFTQLYKWNHGDALLYEHFNRTLWMKVNANGWERMTRDVRTLGKMNEAQVGLKLKGVCRRQPMCKVHMSNISLQTNSCNS